MKLAGETKGHFASEDLRASPRMEVRRGLACELEAEGSKLAEGVFDGALKVVEVHGPVGETIVGRPREKKREARHFVRE